MLIKNRLLFLILRNLNFGFPKAREQELQNNKGNGRLGAVLSEEQHGWEQRLLFEKEIAQWWRQVAKAHWISELIFW